MVKHTIKYYYRCKKIVLCFEIVCESLTDGSVCTLQSEMDDASDLYKSADSLPGQTHTHSGLAGWSTD